MAPALGIDVGNGKCVVAISIDGVVEGVLNEDGCRETPTAVNFAGNCRRFGAACPSFDPKSTISQLKCLFLDDSRLLPYETIRTPDGRLVVRVFHRNKQEEFTATQMLAMLLGHLKRTTARSVESPIIECVIGIPSYFDANQIEAYRNAALIAGLKPLDMLPDGHAVAIEFGHYRADAIAAAKVVFVDVGHCDTQITVARFDGKDPEILGAASNPLLGGRDFEETILEHFVKRCREHHAMDVDSNAKAKARLRVACEKVKKVLSVNREARVSVDCLMDDRDLNEVITKEEFERMSSGLVDKIVETCDAALGNARLGKLDVDSVELVGSGSRIPAISTRLTKFFGKGMSRTLNGSECVARGCALKCEQLFRGKQNEDRRSETKLEVYLQKEDELWKQDREIEKARLARYALESGMYSISNELGKKKIKDKTDEEISRILKQIEDWFDDKGDGACEEDYKKKMEELRSVLRKSSDISYLGMVENCAASSSIDVIDTNIEGALSHEQKSSPMWMLLGWIKCFLSFPFRFAGFIFKKMWLWFRLRFGSDKSSGSTPNDPHMEELAPGCGSKTEVQRIQEARKGEHTKSN